MEKREKQTETALSELSQLSLRAEQVVGEALLTAALLARVGGEARAMMKANTHSSSAELTKHFD